MNNLEKMKEQLAAKQAKEEAKALVKLRQKLLEKRHAYMEKVNQINAELAELEREASL